MKSYRQRLIETHAGVRAALAAGGRRARQTETAIQIATGIELFHLTGNETGYKRQYALYQRYCTQIGFDPIP